MKNPKFDTHVGWTIADANGDSRAFMTLALDPEDYTAALLEQAYVDGHRKFLKQLADAGFTKQAARYVR